MKKPLQAGLIVEGNASSSTVLRLPKMPQELGPIKSKSLRVARRLSNLLRAGYPVADYEGLQEARLILMRVPDSAVPRVVEELRHSELMLKDLSFVLCDTWLSTDVLQPLRSRGASVATLISVPHSGRNWFVGEGQVSAMRQIRRLIEQNAARVIELRPGAKRLYFGAVLLTATLPIPLFVAAQKALRGSGVSGNHLHTLLNEMAQSMLRKFSKGSRATWAGPLTECSEETASAYFEELRRNDPQIADIIAEGLGWGRRGISRHKVPRSDLFREASG